VVGERLWNEIGQQAGLVLAHHSGQLGISVVKLNSEPAKQLGIKETRGVGVAEVKPGSGADQAGERFSARPRYGATKVSSARGTQIELNSVWKRFEMR
jgi:S1-C subfamily serine protease